MLSDNKHWIEDLDRTVLATTVLERLAGSTVLLTGATGLIGSAITEVMLRYNETHDKKISVIAAGRSEDRFKAKFGARYAARHLSFVSFDAAGSHNRIPLHANYIIHAASNADPRKIVSEPAETLMSNVAGLAGLLNYAGEEQVRRLLFVSSSEVYGKTGQSEPLTETDYGTVDPLNPRNSYSEGKRAAETLCAAYAQEFGISCVITRPGHIYGPTASPEDSRVSSMWAYAAARGETLVMKSEGLQRRSYCYCLDCASAILTVLLLGEDMNAYNICNPGSVTTVRELGEAFAREGRTELHIMLPNTSERRAFNPMSNSALNGSRLLALGWKPCFSLEEGINHTVSILREIGEGGSVNA